MTEELSKKRCRPCEGGALPLDRTQAAALLSQISGWSLGNDGRAIFKEYRFKNFKEVVAFFNRIAECAEQENHHPDLKIGYSRVLAELSTHAVGGLSENDFILAAKFDRCAESKGRSR